MSDLAFIGPLVGRWGSQVFCPVLCFNTSPGIPKGWRTSFLAFATARLCTVGPIFKMPPPLAECFGPSQFWPSLCWLFSCQAGEFFKTISPSQSFLARLVHTKRQLYLQHWFQKQPPSTWPRFQRLFFATSTNWGKLLNKKWSKSFLWFRQSAIDSVTSVMLNLTNNLLTQEELSLAIYHEAISGWGYISSSQVDCMYT